MKLKKIVSLIALVIMLINFLLFIFVKISHLTFWIITAIIAIVTYLIVPKLKD